MLGWPSKQFPTPNKIPTVKDNLYSIEVIITILRLIEREGVIDYLNQIDLELQNTVQYCIYDILVVLTMMKHGGGL